MAPKTTDPAVILACFEELLAKARGAVAAALYQEGLAVDKEAVKQVPVDTGRLRGTHYVQPPTDDGRRLEVVVGFGTDYAVFVHENTQAVHVTGNAKFLERALNGASSGFLARLSRRAARNMKAGVLVAPISADTPTRPQDPGESEKKPSKRQLKAERKARVKAKRAKARRRE